MSLSRVNRSGRVVRVERAEHQVPRERGLNRDLGGFQVANLTDKDHVRILPQHGAQRRGEGHAQFGVDRNLHDAVDVVFDGVLAVISLSSIVLSSLSAE